MVSRGRECSCACGKIGLSPRPGATASPPRAPALALACPLLCAEHGPPPPYGWDTRAARATHRAPRARTAHHAHRRALHRAPRCTAHHAPSRATLRHAPPVCSSHSWARAAWGRCSQKNAGRPPIFSSCIRWRACLSSILHRAPRCAPRTTRHAAPRCATHHPCALAIVGPGPPGAAAHKRTPGGHPFSRAVFVGARACRPFCTTRRAAPRTLRHAAPRRATLRHAAPRTLPMS